MTRTLATTILIIGAMLTPAISFADSDTDRSHPMTFVKDSVITTKVKAKLADDKMRTLVHVSVDTDAQGAVLLSGKTTTQKDADQAIAIARGTEGVTSVTSTIVVSKDD